MKYFNGKWLIIVMCVLSLTVTSLLAYSAEPSNVFHITIVGDKANKSAEALHQAAVKYAPKNATIRWLTSKEAAQDKTNDYPSLAKPAAYLCIKDHCSLPIVTPEKLISSIKDFLKFTDMGNETENKFTDTLKNRSILMIIPIFWFFGLLLSLTPCLLPLMIIITSIIGSQAGNISRTKCVTLSLTYVLSLATTYAIAGIVVAYFGLYLQGFMQNKYTIILFSLLFLILGLSLFGFFNFQIPNRWRRAASVYTKQRNSGSYIGVALIGILATLIASPCVAAPLAGILAYIAESGNVQLGGFALFATGIGIGTPVLIVNMIGMEILQKAGEAQKYVKQFFAIILIGISIWLLSRIISPNVTMILWAALVLFTSVYMGLLERQSNIPEYENYLQLKMNLLRSFIKTITIMMFVFGGAILAGSVIGNTYPLSPLGNLTRQVSQPGITLSSFQRVTNSSDLQKAIDKSLKNNKPVMVLFSAKWCMACKEIEENIFPDKAIQKQLVAFTLLYVDLTSPNSDEKVLIKKYEIPGPPVMLFFENGKTPSSRINGNTTVSELSGVLQSFINK